MQYITKKDHYLLCALDTEDWKNRYVDNSHSATHRTPLSLFPSLTSTATSLVIVSQEMKQQSSTQAVVCLSSLDSPEATPGDDWPVPPGAGMPPATLPPNSKGTCLKEHLLMRTQHNFQLGVVSVPVIRQTTSCHTYIRNQRIYPCADLIQNMQWEIDSTKEKAFKRYILHLQFQPK